MVQLEGHRIIARCESASTQPVTGKLHISHDEVIVSGLKERTVLFRLADVTALEHDGRKLLVRTKTDSWMLDLWAFGDHAENMKAAFAAKLGVPLGTRTLAFHERHFLMGLFAIAIVFAICLGLTLRQVKNDAKADASGDDVTSANHANAPTSTKKTKSPSNADLAKKLNDAVTNDDSSKLRALVGSSPDAVNLNTIGGCDSGLHIAMMVGTLENARFLIENGAPVNQPGCYKNTPLHVAVQYCDRPAGVDLLLRHGASVNAKGDMGARPLHIVAVDGCLEYAKKLVKAGANMNAMNDLDETPLFVATDAVTSFLKSKGAKE